MDTKYVNTFIQSSQCKERLNMKRKHLFLQLSFRLKFIVINAPRSTCGCKFGEENFTFFHFRLVYLVREIPSIIHSHTSHTNKNFPKVYLCYIIMQKNSTSFIIAKVLNFLLYKCVQLIVNCAMSNAQGCLLLPAQGVYFASEDLFFFLFFCAACMRFLDILVHFTDRNEIYFFN